MRIRRLVAQGFRNLEPVDLNLDAPFVVFHGQNAQGKTNVLEAIHLLATLKPLKGRGRRELIQWGGNEAGVVGWVEAHGIDRQYRVKLTKSGRQAELDGKRVSDLNEYFAGIRCISFTPLDARIVSEGPLYRRQWLDRAAFTAKPAHLGVVRTVHRILSQKGAALRLDRPDLAVLDALDDQLARVGAELVSRRVEMLQALQPHVSAVHSTLSSGVGTVKLQYKTAGLGDSPADRMKSLRAKLEDARVNELRRRTVLAGPQTDDVQVVLDGRSARTYGSRGQVRSLVLSLKLAEMMAARERGLVPLFLIDDVSSELDRERTAQLVGALSDLGAQVLATTTDPDHMGVLPPHDTLRVAVNAGSLSVFSSNEVPSEDRDSPGE